MKASQSKGRVYPEEPSSYSTCFQLDRERIVHSKAFRRLKSKTQVFIAPKGDHYRTRLTHVLEVTQISRSVARALRLNEDLTEAIALGHDLGHTPFGHAGEKALNILVGHFRHNEHSLRVVDVLEEFSPNFPGLNLTWEVRDGILNHTGSARPQTLEGQVVKICDRIAYLNHDVEDAVRGGIFSETDLPEQVLQVLGANKQERIRTMVTDILHTSFDRDFVAMSPQIEEATNLLRDYLFENFYLNSVAKQEESKVHGVISMLYQYYLEHGERFRGVDNPELEIADYIAGMTDRFAIEEFQKCFLPTGWGWLELKGGDGHRSFF
ncbi:MAG: deoxyguanosinetriphosphate triphosphohydrolase [Firmicutes bacterium]|jgi:dGTPase|nr:deoxyguanosinetriphosphate triphosphohydrolase [Bacillota bacterium]